MKIVLNIIGKAIEKYGKENFTWEIIDTANTIEELNEKESFYILKYKSYLTEFGYNLKIEGENHFLSNETKKKISEAQKGEKNHMFGKKGSLNQTSKRVINLNSREIYESISYCAEKEQISASHISAVCLGKRGSVNGKVFRYIDKFNNIIEPLHNTKIKNRKVINLDTGEIFNSATEAEYLLSGKKQGNISKVCNGLRKTYKGYRWSFI